MLQISDTLNQPDAMSTMILFLAFLFWSWCVVAVLACVIAGHFKDHKANRPDDGDENE